MAQDSIHLETVIINEQFFPLTKRVFEVGDSSLISKKHYRDAGTFLDLHLPIYIRKYGPGLSYSLSVRGSNSAQVELLWNGLSLNSPMQGQSDLALLQFSEGNSIVFDPNNFVYGLSGAISIMDQIQDSPQFQLAISEKISSSIGQDFNAYLASSRQHWKMSLGLHATNDQNRFSYEKNGEEKQITHNGSDQYQAKFNLHFFPSHKNHFRLNTWFSKSKREIPPSIYENSSDAIQGDQAWRILSSYRFLGKSYSFQSKLAFLLDKLTYTSPQKNIFSDSWARQWIQEAEWNWTPGVNQSIHLHFSNKYMQVNSNAYEALKSIDDLHLRMQYGLHWIDRHQIKSGFKLGHRSNKQKLNFAPYLNYQWQMNPFIQVNASIGRKFRYPGFNDLFWSQGGNEDLKNESALSYEIGLNWQPNANFRIENRSYRKKVSNWIQWLPVNGIFEASNIEKVHGAGMENSLEIKGDWKNFQYSLILMHQWTINRYASGPNTGRQLIYTPKTNLKQNSSFRWGSVNLLIDQQWIGKVYTTFDHSESLKAYFLLNGTIEKSFHTDHYRFNVWLRMNNVLDQSYFSIQNYAMPGRSVEAGFQLNNLYK
jgi:vitamin B12 transporter